MRPHDVSSTWQVCSKLHKVWVWNHRDFQTYSRPAGTTMQETCSHLDLLDTPKNPPVPASVKFWIPKQSFSGEIYACDNRWGKKVFLLLPVAAVDGNAPRDLTGNFCSTVSMIIYLHCHYTFSFFSLPETHTCTRAHTLTTKNIEPPPLRKNEASFNPSLSSMNKICWSHLNNFRALQLVLSCFREPIQPPYKCLRWTFMFYPIVK